MIADLISAILNHQSAINWLAVVGGGRYEDLVPHAIVITIFGRETHLLDLPWLIQVKRAAGRPKDLEVIAELETLLELRDRLPDNGET